MARPADYPDWATGAAALVVEQTAGKKAIGWIPEERPPAEFLNWWMERVRDWFAHLQTAPITITPSAMLPREDDYDSFFSGVGWGSETARDVHIDIPIVLPTGSIVSAIDLWILEANLAGEEVTANIYECAITAAPDGSWASLENITSGVTGAHTSLSFTAAILPLTIAANKAYFIEVTLKQTSGASESALWGCILTLA